jgi:hypothetical protein
MLTLDVATKVLSLVNSPQALLLVDASRTCEVWMFQVDTWSLRSPTFLPRAVLSVSTLSLKRT